MDDCVGFSSAARGTGSGTSPFSPAWQITTVLCFCVRNCDANEILAYVTACSWKVPVHREGGGPGNIKILSFCPASSLNQPSFRCCLRVEPSLNGLVKGDIP